MTNIIPPTMAMVPPSPITPMPTFCGIVVLHLFVVNVYRLNTGIARIMKSLKSGTVKSMSP